MQSIIFYLIDNVLLFSLQFTVKGVIVMASTNINVRTDIELKQAAELELFLFRTGTHSDLF